MLGDRILQPGEKTDPFVVIRTSGTFYHLFTMVKLVITPRGKTYFEYVTNDS